MPRRVYPTVYYGSWSPTIMRPPFSLDYCWLQSHSKLLHLSPPPPISSVSILLLDAGFSLEERGGGVGWRFSSSKDFRPTRALTLFSMFESSSLSCEPLFMKRSLGFGFRFGSIFESMMIGFWLFRVSCLMIYGWVKNCGDKMTILRVRKKFSFMMFQAEGVRYY